ncbi:MAG: hypothetical protein KI786_16905 [Mameliella sp.]|nr:hypothetical protein [Phaeodactylibacter sp.]
MGLGIFRPHAPQFAPQEYFDKYPLDSIQLPPTIANDLEDVPVIAQSNFSTPFTKRLLQDTMEWKRAVQGYLGASNFADDCVGDILAAFNQSAYKDNTVLSVYLEQARVDNLKALVISRSAPPNIHLPDNSREP